MLIPSARGCSEALILGNGPSLLGRPWETVPREKVFIIGVNQSWRELPDVDLHCVVDAEQMLKEGAKPYYERMAARGALLHLGGHAEMFKGNVKLDRHDALVFSRYPFRKRHRGIDKPSNPKPPLELDGGVCLKSDPHQSPGTVCYFALQVAEAMGFHRHWFAGLDMSDRKFTGEKSNSVKHDIVWGRVPADVKAKIRVIGPSSTKNLIVEDAWPWTGEADRMLTLKGMTAKSGNMTRQIEEALDHWQMMFKTGRDSTGYQLIGVHVTVCPDVAYPWDEEMVKRIRRELDPGFVPLFRRIVLRTPSGGTMEFLHHGVGRYDPTAQTDPGLRHIEMPSSGYGLYLEKPNIVERWFEGRKIPGSIRALNNLPAPFIPWGDWIWAWALEVFWAATPEEKAAYSIEHQGSESRAEIEKQVELASYIEKDEGPRRRKLMEQLDPQDEKEALAAARGEIKPERKAFVDLGGV